jgi:hypothetical protein
LLLLLSCSDQTAYLLPYSATVFTRAATCTSEKLDTLKAPCCTNQGKGKR